VHTNSQSLLVHPCKLKRQLVSGFYRSEAPTNSRIIACRICHGNSGVIELLKSPPTPRCRHPAEVCLDCIERVIEKALERDQSTLCPSNNCSERLRSEDVQRWLTPKGLDRYVAFIALAMGHSYLATCVLWNQGAQLHVHRQAQVRHLRDLYVPRLTYRPASSLA
jgi:hypothetical protein